MGFIAEYEIGCERLPLVEVAAAVPEATVEVAMVSTAKGHTPFIVRASGGSTAAIERAFESTAFVGEYTLVGQTDETRRYKVLPAVGMEAQLGDEIEDLSKLRALATGESIVERIRVTPTGWVQTGRFADGAALDDFREFWQRNSEFTLLRLTREERGEESGDGLTDRQRDGLRTAYEMGYFEIPRTATLDEVAVELGITASSLSERLRRAQTHLVETTVDSARPPITE